MLVGKWWRGLALLWLVLVSIAATTMFSQIGQRKILRTSILDFLPAPKHPAPLKVVLDDYAQNNSRQLVFLLQGNSVSSVVGAANELRNRMQAGGQWQLSSTIDTNSDFKNLWQWWSEYSNNLLTSDDQNHIQNGDLQSFTREVALRYINPIAMPLSMAKEDPLFLLQNFVFSRTTLPNFYSNTNGWLILKRQQSFATLAVFNIEANVFDMDLNQKLAETVVTIRDRTAIEHPEVDIQTTGALLHIYFGVSQAKQEIALVGGGSVLAILLLLLWVFRSIKPFLLSMLVLSSGLFMGFFISVFCFGSIHILAFVFCSSVIGLGIDYSLHYFCHRSAQENSSMAVRNTMLPTALGLFSSVAAFLILALVPFPGFRQMAVMTALSLLFVWISMVLWFPFLDRTSKRDPTQCMRPLLLSVSHAVRFPHLGKGKIIGVIIILLLVSGWNLMGLSAQDDLRLLQTPAKKLLVTENELADWLGWRAATAYFLVTGKNKELALQHSEQLCSHLKQDPIKAQVNARCLSDWLPSQSTQHLNQSLLAEMAAQEQYVWPELEALGLSSELLTRYRYQLQHSSKILTPENFWQGPIAGELHRFWYDDPKLIDGAAVIVPLSDILAPQQLKQLANQFPDVYWIDPVGDISALIQNFRHYATVFVFAGYALTVLILSLRYGVKPAFQIYLPILLGLLAVLMVCTSSMLSFNLFTLLALILVAGMGIDYGIFFLESKGDRLNTLLSVLVSGATTLLAFGLLALSQTTAISSFGLAIVIGMAVVLLSILLLEFNKK